MNYPSEKKKKRKKSQKSILFDIGTGFLKASHASLVLLDLRKASVQERNPLWQSLRPGSWLLEEQAAAGAHSFSGGAKCGSHRLPVLWGLQHGNWFKLLIGFVAG